MNGAFEFIVILELILLILLVLIKIFVDTDNKKQEKRKTKVVMSIVGLLSISCIIEIIIGIQIGKECLAEILVLICSGYYLAKRAIGIKPDD